MKITQIKRKVTGFNYSNLELTAEIDSETESVTQKVLELDKEVKRLLDAIQIEDDKKSADEMERNNMLRRLDNLKEYIKTGNIEDLKDLPF